MAEPDPEAFFASLIEVKVGKDYSRTDRYRDFRRVFGTAEGRRVLWQILAWSGLFRPVAVKGDPYETYRRDGERNIGLRIMATMNAEPVDDPEIQQETENDGS